MDQRTDEWFAARLGKVTASRVSDVMARTKSGYAATRKNYMMQLLCERLTGNREEFYVNAAMQRGVDLEPIAQAQYEVTEGVIVIETGLVDHPRIEGFAASPDGLVGEDGLLEIKCPNTAQHVEFLKTGKIDKKYQWQMLAQMACTQRHWCDFVSFDDRLPEHLQYKKVRFEWMYNSKLGDQMLEEIQIFLGELKSIIEELEAA